MLFRSLMLHAQHRLLEHLGVWERPCAALHLHTVRCEGTTAMCDDLLSSVGSSARTPWSEDDGRLRNAGGFAMTRHSLLPRGAIVAGACAAEAAGGCGRVCCVWDSALGAWWGRRAEGLAVMACLSSCTPRRRWGRSSTAAPTTHVERDPCGDRWRDAACYDCRSSSSPSCWRAPYWTSSRWRRASKASTNASGSVPCRRKT